MARILSNKIESALGKTRRDYRINNAKSTIHTGGEKTPTRSITISNR